MRHRHSLHLAGRASRKQRHGVSGSRLRMDTCPPPPTDTAVRAAPYDAAYWEARYVKTRGERFEWYTQFGSEASLEDMLQEVLTDVPARVLDLGCGTSQCAVHLASRGHAVVGLDLSPAAVEAASRDSRAQGALLGAAFVLGDATRMPFHDGSFDVVLDKATLDSLDCVGSSEAVAAEMWRVLRPGGMLVSITCRSAAERAGVLAGAFAVEGSHDVWVEGPRAPCPSYCVIVFRRRDRCGAS